MVSWNRWASWVTMPTVSRSDSSDRSRTSWPPIRTTPSVGSYSRATSWLIVVLPAPDGPTSAVSRPAGARKVTPRSACASPSRSGAGSDSVSSEASETSFAVG